MRHDLFSSHSMRSARSLLVMTLLLACAAAPAPGTPPADAASAPAASLAPPDSIPAWLTIDSAARTVRLGLEVAAGAGGASATLNGQRQGGVQIIVPKGWTVRWEWHSRDSSATHSLVVMAEREKLPLEGGRPAFTNAMTRMVTAGLKAGQKDVTEFVAEEAGWFWMLCGVPSHAIQGEWIGLRVDPAATTASAKYKNN